MVFEKLSISLINFISFNRENALENSTGFFLKTINNKRCIKLKMFYFCLLARFLSLNYRTLSYDDHTSFEALIIKNFVKMYLNLQDVCLLDSIQIWQKKSHNSL